MHLRGLDSQLVLTLSINPLNTFNALFSCNRKKISLNGHQFRSIAFLVSKSFEYCNYYRIVVLITYLCCTKHKNYYHKSCSNALLETEKLQNE